MTFVSPLPSPAAYRDSEESTAITTFGKDGRIRRHLHAGQCYVSAEPAALTTVLGSCVAVCLWEAELGIGGINHFVLPHWAGNGRVSARFGSVAISLLIEELCALGCRPESLQAKIFGGSGVMSAGNLTRLGQRNIRIARQVLAEESIPVVAEDVGGTRGRKLIFHTQDGTAWVKRL